MLFRWRQRLPNHQVPNYFVSIVILYRTNPSFLDAILFELMVTSFLAVAIRFLSVETFQNLFRKSANTTSNF